MRKVLFLITSLDMGGAETVLKNLVETMTRKGLYKPVICSIRPVGEVGMTIDKSIKILSLNVNSKFNILAFFRLFRIIRNENPDIINAHLFHAIIMARIMRLFTSGIKVISTLHNENLGGRFRGLILKLTDFLSLANTTISETVTNKMRRIGAVPENKVVTIHNGVNIDRFKEQEHAQNIREEFGLPNDSKILLSVGRLARAKGYDILIDSFSALRGKNNIFLLIIGEGPERPLLESKIKEFGLSGRVFLPGSRHNIEAYLSETDIFILPSRWEGMPMAIIEAMVAKRPVIATAVGGTKDLIEDGQTGFLLNNLNRENLANKIREVLDIGTEGLDVITERAFGAVKDEYSQDKMTRNYEELFNKVIDRGKKIKVCFISMFTYPLFSRDFRGKFGGSELQMSLLSKELAKNQEYDISMLVLDVGQKRRQNIAGVNVIKTYRRGKDIFNLILFPFKFLGGIISTNPHMFICRAAGVEVGITALISKILRKKMIYSLGSNGDVDGSLFSGFTGRIFKFGLKNSDFYIAQSKDQSDMLSELYPSKKDKIKIIKNSFVITDEKTQNKDIILWAGRSAELKRPEVFLRLAKDFPDQKFIMILSEAGRPWIQEKIKRDSKGINNLKILGDMKFEETQSFFSRSVAFVNTSTVEGFPNTFLQAANSYSPILSLKVDPDGFISKNDCGYVCDDKYENLKESLKKIFNDKESYGRKAQNFRKYLEKEHDINNNIKEWKAVLKNFICQKSKK